MRRHALTIWESSLAIAWRLSRGTGAVSIASDSTTDFASASSGETVTLMTARLWTMTEGGINMPKKPRKLGPTGRLPPVHPGEILLEDLMKPLRISINRLSRDLRVPVNRVSEIVNGQRGISADTALRLARYFGNSPQFWVNLQSSYDLQVAMRESASRVDREVQPRDAG